MKRKNTSEYKKPQTKVKNNPAGVKNYTPSFVPKVIRKAVSQTQKDITDWKLAQRLATSQLVPKQYLLQDIYNEVINDALLSSQINNRTEQTVSAPFEVVTTSGIVDEDITLRLRHIPVLVDIFIYMLDSERFGSSLIELSNPAGTYAVNLVNRRNVVADFGRFYPDTSFNNYIEYRDTREYGSWLLEFNSGGLGRLNKVVPHVLFKKFAQSCWSELCEIAGIPPRYLKTDTQNPEMLNRAESMMKDIGAAAWFIIDNNESFEFAQGLNSNGDVYNNLINLCNNEMCMAESGAIIGQDTKNGNESKETVSISILDRLIESDKRMVEMYMNSVVIPAFVRIGWLPLTTSRFRFAVVEDNDKLWNYTKELLPYKNVDNSFIEEKFGIKVSDKSEAGF